MKEKTQAAEFAGGDYLVRCIARDENILGLVCVTTNLVNEARELHSTYPTATAGLGRALTGGLLMGALLYKGQRIALKFEGNGPLKKIIVEAEGDGTVKGYVVNPEVDLPPKNGKLDVAAAVGNEGFLTVMKDLRLKEPYMGVVKLYSGEIAEDLAFYLAESEQVPSAVGLGVFVEPDWNVSAAGGFLIQSLPPANEEIIDDMVRRIEKMPPVTELLRNGKTPEDLMQQIFGKIPYQILAKKPVSFRCSCSRERIEQALISLGTEEIDSIIAEKRDIDVSCHFCCKKYVFGKVELERLLKEIQ